jgi:class 3 adenylate cyclase
LAAILRARLSHSVALGVFLSILVIEGIIFVPSYLRREREILALKQDLVTAKLWGASQQGAGAVRSPEATAAAMGQLGAIDGIMGWRIYDQNRQLLAESAQGKKPEFFPVRIPQGTYDDCLEVNQLRIMNPVPPWTAIAGWDGPYFDMLCEVRGGSPGHFLAIRIDGTPITQELWNFGWRISGLVVVISLFVTGTVIVVLWRLVIEPILRLRGDLLLAKVAIHNADLEQEFCQATRARRDELGDLSRSFEDLYHAVTTEFTARKAAEALAIAQQETSERLLLNILPAMIAERLKHGEEIIADGFAEASVLFADLVDFTNLAGRTDPVALVRTLNEIFSQFDELTSQLGLEKIKTIGDAYMVVGGLPQPCGDHAEAIADMALGMQRVMTEYRSPAGEHFRLRIGIHIGAVVAGVIGKRKFIYDLWGDAVNVASRMESQGVPEQIQISEAMYLRLKETFLCQSRGAIAIKGKGEMHTYFLLGRR